MKKLLFLFILVPLSVFAKFYDGTITYNDGSTKKGLIEIPENASRQEISFKTDLKAKPEKISIDDVKGFEITSGKNDVPTKFVSIYLAKGPLYGTKECKVDKKKSWVRIEKEGGITLYSSYIGYRPGVRGGAIHDSGWPPETYFFLGRPDKDYAVFFWMYIESAGTTIAVNNFKVIKRLTATHFETKCPELENFIDKDDFKTNGIVRIVELYDEHCGTK
ncbi:MAG TPA: hypothetical protein PKN96_07475 [Flavobacterium sp.]|uniref:hypothetical protein n=1 Tax=Flavobacterium sp. TaxID=239 RepID=UPI002C265695|nr:hypothetical protein [Flavobacterium sp.]HNP33117.1 hypothetical protein [Flavobacterium sp.]